MAESVLGKINYLTEEQYQAARASGEINENEIYLTPDPNVAETSIGTITQTLWENPSPLSSVDTLDITLKSSDYDELVCYFYNWVLASPPLIDSVTVPKGYSFNLVSNIYVGGVCHYGMRSVIRNSDTSFTFGKQYGVANANPSNTINDGSWLVPVKIVGRKRTEFPKQDVIYDEAETIIGEYLGKPLYRKVIVIGTPASKTSYQQHNIENFRRIVNVYGSFRRSNVDTWNTIPGNYSSWESYVYDFTPSIFTLKFSDNQWNNGVNDCEIVLEYTKTSD